MAIDMLTHFSSLLNRQIHSHETVNIYLSKIQALLEVAMRSESFSGTVPHDYLWTLSGLVGEAKTANQDSLSSLLSDV